MSDTLPLKEKFIGALLGTHVGDALGMPVEGFSRDKIIGSFGRVEGLLDSRLGIGTYTDDTQMMIGVAESLIERERFDGEDMAWRFIRNFEITRGYGSGTVQSLLQIRKGGEWSKAGTVTFPDGSYGNGAAMRIAPVGLLYSYDITNLREMCRNTSLITHTHPLGINGAQLQAYSVAMALNMDPAGNTDENRGTFLEKLSEFSKYLEEPYPERIGIISEFFRNQPSEKEIISRMGNNVVSVNSVPTSIYCALKHLDDFREGVLMAVNLGGDTDTMGAMTGAILGAYNGLKAIPDIWLDKLENGKKGRDYIIDLANRLFELYRVKFTK